MRVLSPNKYDIFTDFYLDSKITCNALLVEMKILKDHVAFDQFS